MSPVFPGSDGHHLAQVNVARLLAPLQSAQLADFVAWLDPINGMADASPGFVWRLQTESGNATDVRVSEDDMLLVNLSVWESLQALWNFVYATRHLDALRRRREWFERMAVPILALWWVPAGATPTVEEAVGRLTLLRERGPGAEAFTFKAPFPPPG